MRAALRTTAAAARCGLPGTSFSTGSRCQSSPARAPARLSCRAQRAVAFALPPARQRRRARLVGVVKLVVHEARDDGRLAHRLVTQEDELILRQRTHGRRHCDRLPVSAAPRRAGRLHAAVPEDGRGASEGRPRRTTTDQPARPAGQASASSPWRGAPTRAPATQLVRLLRRRA